MQFTDNKSIYLQIVDIFCERILLREWKPNERIPAIREISVALEVNPNTAIRAYSYLEERDIIYNKRGVGYFVANNGFEKTLDLCRQIFITTDLPLLVKNIKLLNIENEELVNLIKEYYEKK